MRRLQILVIALVAVVPLTAGPAGPASATGGHTVVCRGFHRTKPPHGAFLQVELTKCSDVPNTGGAGWFNLENALVNGRFTIRWAAGTVTTVVDSVSEGIAGCGAIYHDSYAITGDVVSPTTRSVGGDDVSADLCNFRNQWKLEDDTFSI